MISNQLSSVILPVIILVYSLLYAPMIYLQGVFHPNQLAVSLMVFASTFFILGFCFLLCLRLYVHSPRIWNVLDSLCSAIVLGASLRIYALVDTVSTLVVGKLAVLCCAVLIDIGIHALLSSAHWARWQGNAARLVRWNHIHSLRWHYLTATGLAIAAIGLNLYSKRFRIDSEALRLACWYTGGYFGKMLLASIPKHFISDSLPKLPNQLSYILRWQYTSYGKRLAYMCWSQLFTTFTYFIFCYLTIPHTPTSFYLSLSGTSLLPVIGSGFITTIVGACSALILMHPLAHSACVPLNKLSSLLGAKLGSIAIAIYGSHSAIQWQTKDWNLIIAAVTMAILITGELLSDYKIKIFLRSLGLRLLEKKAISGFWNAKDSKFRYLSPTSLFVRLYLWIPQK